MIVRSLAHFNVEMSTFLTIFREINRYKRSSSFILFIAFLLLIFNRKKINISTFPLFYKEKIDIKPTLSRHKTTKLDIKWRKIEHYS
jgi:hypothetical protein